MRGSEISHGLFFNHVLPVIRERFPVYLNSISAAAVGEGSDVLGFDDAISQDHNFGPRIALFLPDELHRNVADELIQHIKSALPVCYEGFWDDEFAYFRVSDIIFYIYGGSFDEDNHL